jgi:hypothetical protein
VSTKAEELLGKIVSDRRNLAHHRDGLIARAPRLGEAVTAILGEAPNDPITGSPLFKIMVNRGDDQPYWGLAVQFLSGDALNLAITPTGQIVLNSPSFSMNFSDVAITEQGGRLSVGLIASREENGSIVSRTYDLGAIIANFVEYVGKRLA